MRRNPLIPLTGASFLTNPRRKNKAVKRSTRGRFVRKNAKTRTNGLAFRTNRKGKAKRASPAKRLVMRLNRGLGISGHPFAAMHRMRTNKRRSNGLALRTNGLALRTNGLALRTNGLALRTNRKRRNPDILGAAKGMIAKVPVVGRTLAGAVGPIAVGLAAGALHLFVIGRYGTMLPAVVQPIGYTIGGVGVAALVGFIPLGSPALRTSVGLAAITVGAALDLIRYFKADAGPALSDGGMYELGDIDLGNAYAGASPADAYSTAGDLGADEIDAAQRGGRFWFHRFPFVRRATGHGRHPGQSDHAGQRGHQWGWVIKFLGFENFQRLSAMPAPARQEYIQKLRQYAIAALPGGAQNPGDVRDSYQGALYAGGGY